jgi:transcriptional regulator with GAF, ATPase, and Fis domain/tetratricopeptide (TPR) repeat protein
MPAEPRLAGRYRVLGPLGAGGMGVVFRVADELAGGREVALKTLRADEHAQPALLERLRAEFQVLRQLDHPNVARVYDFGVGEPSAADGALGVAWFTSELCTGGTLLAWADGRSLAELGPVLLQCCEALAYVHARGLLHRDVKPENFIVGGAPHAPLVKLIDFGLTGSPEDAARAGAAAAGTVGYLAPEVAGGEAPSVPADLYALGVTLYEALAGRPPFRGDSDRATLNSRRRERPAPPSAARSELPAALDAVVLRLLAPAPADRWQSADEVAEAIAEALVLPRGVRPGPAAMLATIPFAARAAELAQAVAWSELGESPVLLVGGAAGMGKSRLLAEVRGVVQLGGGTFLSGRCARGGPLLGAWVPILRALVARLGPDAPLVRACAADLADLVPGLAAPGAVPTRLVAARERFAVLSRLADLVEGAGIERLVVALEDLTWADRETIELFFLLGRRLASAPAGARRVRLCATHRAGPRSEIAERGGELGQVATIALGPLGRDDCAALLRGAFPDAGLPAALVDAAFAAGGGSPLLVSAYARSLVESGAVRRRAGRWEVAAGAGADGAPALEEVLERWLDVLRPRERDLFATLSLAQGPLDLPALARAAEQEPPDALAAVGALVQRGFVKVCFEEGALLFEPAHATIAEHAAERLPAAAAAATHLRLAEALEARAGGAAPGAPGTPVGFPAEEIASHFAAAGAPERAARYRLSAAARARALCADEHAGRLYRLALHGIADGATRRVLLESLADCRLRSGDLRGALAVARLLGEDARRRDAPADRARALTQAGSVWQRLGRHGRAARALASAIELAHGAPTLEAAAREALAEVLYERGEIDGARAALEAALVLRLGVGDELGATPALRRLGWVRLVAGDGAAALEPLERSAAVARASGGADEQALAALGLGQATWFLGRSRDAAGHFRDAERLASSVGLWRGRAGALIGLATAERDAGEYESALAALDRAERMCRESGGLPGLITALNNRATIFIDHADYGRALATLEEAAAIGKTAGLRRMAATLSLTRARLLSWCAGADADAGTSAAITEPAASGVRVAAAEGLALRSLFLIASGRTDEALRYAERAAALPGQAFEGRLAVREALARALLAAGSPRAPDAAAELVELARQGGVAHALAPGLYWLAAARTAAGDGGGAAEPLLHALSLAARWRLGETAWRAEELLAQRCARAGEGDLAASHRAAAERLRARIVESLPPALRPGWLASRDVAAAAFHDGAVARAGESPAVAGAAGRSSAGVVAAGAGAASAPRALPPPPVLVPAPVPAPGAPSPAPGVPAPAGARHAGALEGMVRRVLASPADLEEAMRLVLDTAVEATGATRGLLALVGPDGTPELLSPRGDPDRTISRAVVAEAVRAGAGLLVRDALADPRFRRSESVTSLALQSVLAVPLSCRGRAVAAIYLEGAGEGVFGEADLALLEAFAEQISPHVEALRALRARTAELERLRRAYQDEVAPRYRDIVAASAPMRAALAVLDRAARTNVTVLVQGESGTGKELFARALHFAGPRRDRPFVAVNCAALPETLLESELFGHVRGAFTGAVGARAGLFEEADGGTIFLDEIGDTSPALQAKLLRVLQDGELRPIGATDVRRVDVRLVSASLRDLAELVAAGRFREDLFYRVNTVVVRLPPLRERPEDVPLLAERLLARIAGDAGRPRSQLTRRALGFLMEQPWPGNVRQLENVLRAASALAAGSELDVDDLREVMSAARGTAAAPPAPGSLRGAVAESQLVHARAALEACDWNVSVAARRLRVSRQALYRIMKRHGLKRARA